MLLVVRVWPEMVNSESWSSWVSHVNGSIRVEIPNASDFGISMRTRTGGIHNDFELSRIDEHSQKRVEGTVGTGGPMIDLRTTNGRITLKYL